MELVPLVANLGAVKVLCHIMQTKTGKGQNNAERVLALLTRYSTSPSPSPSPSVLFFQ